MSSAFGGQDRPAAMLAKNVETLKNMNGGTAKFAKWYVRIIDPKIIDYKFSAKCKLVDASKFECILVSKDPSQHMLAVVPFDFKDPNAAQKAIQKFTRRAFGKLQHQHSMPKRNLNTMGAR